MQRRQLCHNEYTDEPDLRARNCFYRATDIWIWSRRNARRRSRSGALAKQYNRNSYYYLRRRKRIAAAVRRPCISVTCRWHPYIYIYIPSPAAATATTGRTDFHYHVTVEWMTIVGEPLSPRSPIDAVSVWPDLTERHTGWWSSRRAGPGMIGPARPVQWDGLNDGTTVGLTLVCPSVVRGNLNSAVL